MIAILVEGFLFGLVVVGPFCLASCAPVFLSAVLAREERRPSGRFLAMGEFLAGRLLGYAAIGALAGWLGAHVTGGRFALFSLGVNAALGCAMLLYGVSHAVRGNALCRLMGRFGDEGRFPALLGLLTGLNLCPPFLTAIKRVMDLGGVGAGLLFFGGFFVASVIVMAPLLGASYANALSAIRSVGRVACATVGLIFLCGAVSGFAAMRTPVAAAETAQIGDLPVVEKNDPVPHRVRRESGAVVEVTAFSKDLAPTTQGYGGHVPVAVTLDMRGVITRVEILPGHAETPGYGDAVEASDLTARLIGKRASDPLTIGKDVDAVSGATMTSAGVVDAARETARVMAATLLPLYAATPPSPGAAADATSTGRAAFRFSPWPLGLWVLVGIGLWVERRRAYRLRPYVLLTSLLFLGVALRTFFSVQHVFDLSLVRLPPVRTHLAWYIVAAGALGSSLLAGRVYCGYVCPFGAATEFLGRVTGAPLRIAPVWDRRLRRLKYGVLLALVLAFAATRNPRLLLVEPFGDAFSLGFLSGPSALLRTAWIGFLITASLLCMRFFCRFLCPAGAAMAFLARHRILPRWREDACVECGECMVSCPKREGRP